jgi:hypothetical protein
LHLAWGPTSCDLYCSAGGRNWPPSTIDRRAEHGSSARGAITKAGKLALSPALGQTAAPVVGSAPSRTQTDLVSFYCELHLAISA